MTKIKAYDMTCEDICTKMVLKLTHAFQFRVYVCCVYYKEKK